MALNVDLSSAVPVRVPNVRFSFAAVAFVIATECSVSKDSRHGCSEGGKACWKSCQLEKMVAERLSWCTREKRDDARFQYSRNEKSKGT